MGGMNKRGFLKTITALSSAVFIPAAVADDVKWDYALFDCGTQLGISGEMDGLRHCARMFLKFQRGDERLWGHMPIGDVVRAHADSVADIQQQIRWQLNKRRQIGP
jgi:hypothetical protein